MSNTDQLTAWGTWVRQQPRGTLTRAMRETGLSWSSVVKAQTSRVTFDVAERLSRFTKGAVEIDAIRKRTVGPMVTSDRVADEATSGEA